MDSERSSVDVVALTVTLAVPYAGEDSFVIKTTHLDSSGNPVEAYSSSTGEASQATSQVGSSGAESSGKPLATSSTSGSGSQAPSMSETTGTDPVGKPSGEDPSRKPIELAGKLSKAMSFIRPVPTDVHPALRDQSSARAHERHGPVDGAQSSFNDGVKSDSGKSNSDDEAIEDFRDTCEKLS